MAGGSASQLVCRLLHLRRTLPNRVALFQLLWRMPSPISSVSFVFNRKDVRLSHENSRRRRHQSCENRTCRRRREWLDLASAAIFWQLGRVRVLTLREVASTVETLPREFFRGSARRRKHGHSGARLPRRTSLEYGSSTPLLRCKPNPLLSVNSPYCTPW